MKRLVKLTEGDLHKIVKESVKRILREGLNNYDYYFSVPDYDYDQNEPWEDTFGVKETINGLEIYDYSNELICVLRGKRLRDYKTGPDQAGVDMSSINDDKLIADMRKARGY